MNPLLSDWTTPFGLPPFDLIRDEDFGPAVEAALEEARGNVRAIGDAADAPTFANTIVALETADKRLSRVLSAFWAVAVTACISRRNTVPRRRCP